MKVRHSHWRHGVKSLDSLGKALLGDFEQRPVRRRGVVRADVRTNSVASEGPARARALRWSMGSVCEKPKRVSFCGGGSVISDRTVGTRSES